MPKIRAAWGHWGLDPKKYTGWKSHSNRLIPIYSFGISLAGVAGEHSPYRSEEQLKQLYGRVPERTLNPQADYFDQTDVYKLQQAAIAAGKKYVVLMVFDGMDWQTTWAAATYRNGKVAYREGRGSGNYFQDYRGVATDFGCFVTSPYSGSFVVDPNKQTAVAPKGVVLGGYDWRLAGPEPWTPGQDLAYLISKSEQRKQAYTDSAASATSMTAGVKSYNDAINVDSQGKQVEPIARAVAAAGLFDRRGHKRADQPRHACRRIREQRDSRRLSGPDPAICWAFPRLRIPTNRCRASTCCWEPAGAPNP